MRPSPVETSERLTPGRFPILQGGTAGARSQGWSASTGEVTRIEAPNRSAHRTVLPTDQWDATRLNSGALDGITGGLFITEYASRGHQFVEDTNLLGREQ